MFLNLYSCKLLSQIMIRAKCAQVLLLLSRKSFEIHIFSLYSVFVFVLCRYELELRMHTYTYTTYMYSNYLGELLSIIKLHKYVTQKVFRGRATKDQITHIYIYIYIVYRLAYVVVAKI